MLKISRFSYTTKKISCKTIKDLQEKLNEIDGKILSVKSCLPEETDTNQWFSVYYEYKI